MAAIKVLVLIAICAAIYGLLFACAKGVDLLAKLHRDCDPWEPQQ